MGQGGDLRPVRIDGEMSGGYFYGVTAEEMSENTVTKTAPITWLDPNDIFAEDLTDSVVWPVWDSQD